MRTRFAITVCTVLAALATGACGGGSHHEETTNFQQFVQGLAGTQIDDADPVSIDTLQFDQTEDPHAFDALFQ